MPVKLMMSYVRSVALEYFVSNSHNIPANTVLTVKQGFMMSVLSLDCVLVPPSMENK